jgi:phytoene dehydrogenase-like protein
MNKTISAPRYDAAIIGAGHNGLVAAAYLAKAGLKVIVLERRAILGGVAATEEVFPGYHFNTGSDDAGLFLPEILAELGIGSSELEFNLPPTIVHSLLPGDDGLTLWRDPARTVEEIARCSPRDAENFPRFISSVDRFASILREILTLAPPPLPKFTLAEVMAWLPVGLQVKRLGDAELRQFLRILPMPVKDFLDEWFENSALKAALGFAGVMGSFQGPLASGTTFQFLYHAIGAGESGFRSSRFVRGGTGALSSALAAAARKLGAEIRTSCPVNAINLDGDRRATGVSLANGERISCRAVLSNADPRTTFLELVGAPNLPLRFVREVVNIKYRGSTARINLALKGLPDFKGISGSTDPLTGHILICPDLIYLERAYDAAKYGAISPLPALEFVIPTLLDPSVAPPGSHILSIDVRYAPYRLREGDWDAQRERLADRVVDLIAQYSPDLPGLIAHRKVLTPLDYERDYGLPEGSIYHGQMGLDQLLFMRPVGGSHGSPTPVSGLYLCGSGAHPGGGVTGAPGFNAARQLLRDIR